MQFYFHVLFGNEIEYDPHGQDFPSLDLARASAVDAIRKFFLIHPDPRPGIITNSIVCITDDKGDVVEQVPFPDAFRSDGGPPDIRYSPGNA
jgi:hypothetical protein